MKTTTLLTALTTLLPLALAQDQYSINPDSVSESLRDFWCQQQIAQCPIICSQTSPTTETLSNDCTASDLTYSCVCDNGFSPNISEYSQTLPFFICQEWGTQCVANCGQGNTGCQSACTADHPCGAQNPTRQNTSTLTGTATRTGGSVSVGGASTTGAADGGQVVTSDGVTATLYGLATKAAGDSGTSSSGGGLSHVRVWALSAGQTFGTVALFGGMVGGFAILL